MPILEITLNEGQILIFGILVVLTSIYFYNKTSNYKTRLQNELRLKQAEQTAAFQKQEAELKFKYQDWAIQELEKFKQTEIDSIKTNLEQVSLQAAANVLQQWKMNEEAKIRQDAISRSYAVNLGKISEHLVPFHGKFPFNPNDARFIGSPVDLLIFDGASENREDINIYFAEIKTGKSRLTELQRRIQSAVKDGRTYWIQINPDNDTFIQDNFKTSRDKIEEILKKIRTNANK
ncbi:Holliday junction resolvase-like protein [Flavisolibacter ginsenosidimutans]|uniref:Holliday junction resolvase-related domain-containing protein n=1 Tax=Flavisolibacter ginsenosidimutans TaxID=661481 RepID=A0A5B8UMG3_9BACT|nr:Holliday junction resolvase-like protein [Flavisolibacter ginsenosidimutans]QEC57867.1 hypothetical protein FSB75_18815 [Flavisolibacter ginsenosidimutans]